MEIYLDLLILIKTNEYKTNHESLFEFSLKKLTMTGLINPYR